jgi:hypothetical protein
MTYAIGPSTARQFFAPGGQPSWWWWPARRDNDTGAPELYDASGEFPDAGCGCAARVFGFAKINLSEAKFSDVDLSNVSIEDCHVTGMKIDGLLVSELLRSHRDKV